jgi:hypothetical protein
MKYEIWSSDDGCELTLTREGDQQQKNYALKYHHKSLAIFEAPSWTEAKKIYEDTMFSREDRAEKLKALNSK